MRSSVILLVCCIVIALSWVPLRRGLFDYACSADTAATWRFDFSRPYAAYVVHANPDNSEAVTNIIRYDSSSRTVERLLIVWDPAGAITDCGPETQSSYGKMVLPKGSWLELDDAFRKLYQSQKRIIFYDSHPEWLDGCMWRLYLIQWGRVTTSEREAPNARILPYALVDINTYGFKRDVDRIRWTLNYSEKALPFLKYNGLVSMDKLDLRNCPEIVPWLVHDFIEAGLFAQWNEPAVAEATGENRFRWLVRRWTIPSYETIYLTFWGPMLSRGEEFYLEWCDMRWRKKHAAAVMH